MKVATTCPANADRLQGEDEEEEEEEEVEGRY